jgi:putative transposase
VLGAIAEQIDVPASAFMSYGERENTLYEHLDGYCQLAKKRNLCHTDGMKTNTTAPNYKGFRFPPEIISHAVWLYFRFSLSYRDVQELLAERGTVVTYETVRQWCLKFGQTYANELRHRRPRCEDKWHMDEMVLTIQAKKHYLWRAVDQDGNVLDILVQSQRNKKAAKRFFRKLLKGLQYVPRVIITDKLKSYGAAKREILPGVEHRQHKRLNNRAENSHQPTRLREKKMRKFKSAGHAQRFLSAFGPIYEHFKPRCHRMNAQDYRATLQSRFQVWNEITEVKLVA